MVMMMNKMQYPADENQLELYKKFPTTHFLSNPINTRNILAWSTFWRRNMHRFAEDYLQISLYEYQQIALYEMGNSSLICIIASRNNAKSFMIALYGCCRAILYPGTKVVIGSATRGQSKLIVTEKIENELMEWSPQLRREIQDVKRNGQEVSVKFHNGSTITVFTANDNARGLRSHTAIREEFRQIDQKIDNKVISPFQTVRNRPYIKLEYYKDIKILKEEPVDIYLSSSWHDLSHWMWGIVDGAYEGMLKGDGSVLLAFDESVTIKHGLKTMNYLIREKKKQDPVTWKVEFLNLKVKDSASSFFTYSLLTKRQTLRQVFYPRDTESFRHKKKNKYAIPKQDGEVRVISCDISFVQGEQNDNSVYSCIRGMPESMTYETEVANKTEVEIKQGYRREYVYIESNQIGDTTKQAIRIRELYDDFDADYIVIDARNAGVQIIYSLGKILYNESRGVEYEPLKTMNNDTYADVVKNPNAKPVIYAINATQQLNSDIAYSFRRGLTENKIDLLLNYNIAKEEILDENKDYVNEADLDKQLSYEVPFLETQLMINECSELLYEKSPQTGAIKIFEHGGNRKDRYSSASYGNYFLDQLELDLLSDSSDYEFCTFIN